MKDAIREINWEKVGVYIAAIVLIGMFASKIVDLGERLSRVEGKLEILIEEKMRK